jgi:PIN domain nuclease of toxin-antitoxin system
LISAVSAMEITLKHRLGKLSDATPFIKNGLLALHEFEFDQLPISLAHAGLAGSLLQDHKDPFDRLLAAQAIIEKLPIVSADTALDQFGITRIW